MVRTSAASIQPRRFRLLETHTASALSIMPGNKVNPRPGQKWMIQRSTEAKDYVEEIPRARGIDVRHAMP